MKKMKVGILREGKMPHDKRVALIPSQCRQVLEIYPEIDLVVQPSSWRTFADEEFKKGGIILQEDLSDCDILLGIKEVPINEMMPGKTYMFFSHTIKKQPRNQELFQEMIKKKITLIDYECLVDKQENRVIGFGRFAGIVGAYNGIMAYGLKYKMFELKDASKCH